MIKTFTLQHEITAEQTEKDQDNPSFQVAEPSLQVIQNILNYSKNLEIRHSKYVQPIEVIKS